MIRFPSAFFGEVDADSPQKKRQSQRTVNPGRFNRTGIGSRSATAISPASPVSFSISWNRSRAAGAPTPDKRARGIRIGTGLFIADVTGALWHEGERTLMVADLHLEKGSSFARRGMLLPPYDSAATLAVLAAAIAHYDPRRVISLGDGFHDDGGATRLSVDCRAALRAMQAKRDWVWVAGNHDARAPAGLPGEHVPAVRVNGVVARHEPATSLGGEGEIAGHLHPVARIVARGGSVRRRCFAADGRRCVMPAFGAYAGGLNLRDRAFAALFDDSRLEAVVIGEGRLHIFGAGALAGG